jgi:hypothetical protein
MREWFIGGMISWQGKTKVLGGKPSSVTYCSARMQHDCTGLEPGPPRWEANKHDGAYAWELIRKHSL